MSIQVRDEKCPVIRFYAPEWFARPDFVEFLQRYAAPQPADGRRLATWHTGGEISECSDVFILCDGGELSDDPPDDIRDFIIEAMADRGLRYALGWLVNFAAPDAEEISKRVESSGAS